MYTTQEFTELIFGDVYCGVGLWTLSDKKAIWYGSTETEAIAQKATRLAGKTDVYFHAGVMTTGSARPRTHLNEAQSKQL